MTVREALNLANEESVDLVEVAPQAKPPVCKIMDYGKYKYLQKQKFKEAKKNATIIQVKEVKMRPKTDGHDVDYKIRHVKRFLEEGDKAKITVMFRGREITHKDRGRRLINKVIEAVEEEAIVEMPPRMEGRTMIAILAPRNKKEARKEASPAKPKRLRRQQRLEQQKAEQDTAQDVEQEAAKATESESSD